MVVIVLLILFGVVAMLVLKMCWFTVGRCFTACLFVIQFMCWVFLLVTCLIVAVGDLFTGLGYL